MGLTFGLNLSMFMKSVHFLEFQINVWQPFTGLDTKRLVSLLVRLACWSAFLQIEMRKCVGKHQTSMRQKKRKERYSIVPTCYILHQVSRSNFGNAWRKDKYFVCGCLPLYFKLYLKKKWLSSQFFSVMRERSVFMIINPACLVLV